MAKVIISAPSIEINNKVYPIVGGSLVISLGLGEASLKAQSSGGGRTEAVYSLDVNTRISKGSFKMYCTPENERAIEEIKLKENRNTAYISGNVVSTDKPFTKYLESFTVTNDPQFDLKYEGDVTVEWQAEPAK